MRQEGGVLQDSTFQKFLSKRGVSDAIAKRG